MLQKGCTKYVRLDTRHVPSYNYIFLLACLLHNIIPFGFAESFVFLVQHKCWPLSACSFCKCNFLKKYRSHILMSGSLTVLCCILMCWCPVADKLKEEAPVCKLSQKNDFPLYRFNASPAYQNNEVHQQVHIPKYGPLLHIVRGHIQGYRKFLLLCPIYLLTFFLWRLVRSQIGSTCFLVYSQVVTSSWSTRQKGVPSIVLVHFA